MDYDSEKRSPSKERFIIDYSKFIELLKTAKSRILNNPKSGRLLSYEGIVGIPRGGLIPGVYLSHMLDLPLISLNAALDLNYNHPKHAFIYVDDVIDTGTTVEHLENSHWLHPDSIFVALIGKPWSPKKDYIITAHDTEDWVQFMWENNE